MSSHMHYKIGQVFMKRLYRFDIDAGGISGLPARHSRRSQAMM